MRPGGGSLLPGGARYADHPYSPDKNGIDRIIVLAGANGEITETDVKHVLADFDAGNLIVQQNPLFLF